MKRRQGNTPRLLFVSDDIEMCGGRAQALGRWDIGFEITDKVEAALEQQGKGPYDLFVIDVYGQDLDSVSMCQRLRAASANPILLLTYENAERAALSAYEAGVDEYVVKPIELPLFQAKVKAWLRRSWTLPVQALPPVEVGDACLLPARRELLLGEKAVRLTNLELRLLHLLMTHQGQTVHSEEIISRVWRHGGADKDMLKHTVRRLRLKLDLGETKTQYVQTVHGEGYRFASGDELAEKQMRS